MSESLAKNLYAYQRMDCNFREHWGHPVARVIPHIPVEVDLPGLEANGIVTQSAAGGRVVVMSPGGGQLDSPAPAMLCLEAV